MHGATYEPEVYLETYVQAMYNDFKVFLSPALNHLLTTYFTETQPDAMMILWHNSCEWSFAIALSLSFMSSRYFLLKFTIGVRPLHSQQIIIRPPVPVSER